MSTMKLLVGADSKRGSRFRNEDAWNHNKAGTALALSDGVGGGKHGDIASRIACNAAIDHLDASKPIDLANAFAAANNAVFSVSRWLRCPREMGATLTVACCDEESGRLQIAWAGDSLAYILRNDGRFACLTNPHRANELSNALTNDVGYGETADPSYTSTVIAPGDRLLLCTDGVWDALQEIDLRNYLEEQAHAPWIADAITRAAIEAAGQGADNATAIVAIAVARDEADDETTRNSGDPVALTPVRTPPNPVQALGQA